MTLRDATAADTAAADTAAAADDDDMGWSTNQCVEMLTASCVISVYCSCAPILL